MIAFYFFAVAYGCLIAAAVAIPLADTASIQHGAILAPVSVVPVPTSTITAALKDSNTNEEGIAHALANFAARHRSPDQKYSEYTLSTCMYECAERLAADPTPILGQSSIGNTALKDVRFYQCNVAYVKCHEDCLTTHKSDMAEWPPGDSMGRPVLTSSILRNCLTKAITEAKMDHHKVSVRAHMMEEDFGKYNTVGMCNWPLTEEVIECQDMFANQTAVWDLNYQPWE